MVGDFSRVAVLAIKEDFFFFPELLLRFIGNLGRFRKCYLVGMMIELPQWRMIITMNEILLLSTIAVSVAHIPSEWNMEADQLAKFRVFGSEKIIGSFPSF